ncbi:GNAT family N-acetyltransferase [Gallibacterium salpingitidis]|uniref:Acetyltransferase n=1 Tax=Gallibacterium salpingitidis TaxID=505341 RepID=A0A1A7NTL0_9PAST|nr:GNAT family N-acetyltransferase [Gallibacterium salpingitidis]OBW92334.1 acetyltransferase [Gallibacterium salpingitidis]
MQLHCKTFSQLTTTELFQIYQARTAIFVVEQQCPYQEVDHIDCIATHLWFTIDQQLVAYARIYQQQEEVHFGRVLVMPEYRGQGIAKQLITQVLTFIQQTSPNLPIVIQAQHYLQAFYQHFGFVATSTVYLEDNIPHIDMCKAL